MSGPVHVGAADDNLIRVDFQTGRRAQQTPLPPQEMPGAWPDSASPTGVGCPRPGSASHEPPPRHALRAAPPPAAADHESRRGALGAAGGLASRLLPPIWPVAAGLALVTASSLAAALTVTAPLLEVSAALAGTGANSPVLVTRLLGTVLGTLGLQAGFGVGAAMLTVAGLAATGLAGPGSRQAAVGRSLTSLGLGTMLSPFWLVAASGHLGAAAPGLALACACVIGLQGLSHRLEHQAALSPLGRGLTATVLSAVAPLGAGLALGLAPLHCLLAAITTLTLGLLGASSLLWMAHLASTDDRSDAALRRTQVPIDRSKRLALPGESNPTVFYEHPELREFAQAVQTRHQAGKTCEGLLLLHGPTGTGKTDAAQAIANLGTWDMYQAPTSALFDAKAPLAVLVPWFEQLRRRAKSTGRTQVAFLDEAELLLCGPSAEDADDRPLALAGAFADLLGELQLKNSDVLVIVGTNHPQRLAAKVWQRFGGGSLHAVVAFTVPSAAQLSAMVTEKLARAHARYLGLRAVKPYRPDPVFVAQAAEALAARGAVGRDVTAAVNEALTAANAAFGAKWRRLEQGQLDAFVEQRLRRSWHLTLLD